MLSKKTLQIAIIFSIFISNASMAVMCARLQSVSGGEYHSLALMEDNTLWACGSNDYNQLGLGSDVTESVLALEQVLGEDGVGFLQNVVAFDAGWYHSLAADTDGTLWAWGKNTNGQLGDGDDLQINEYWDVPQKVHGINDVGYLSDTVDIVYVSAGRSGKHSLVVNSNGHVYSFGYNNYGQCGDETYSQKNTPVLVLDDDTQTTGVYLGDIATIIAVDAGVYHSLALDDEGYVWEWGGNNDSSYPQKVPGVGGTGELSHIVGISTCYHSVAVDSNGFVYEWEDGNPYKVADGEMGTASGDLENIVEVSAGYGTSSGYSIALTNDGHVLVWSYGGEPAYIEDGEMDTQSGLLEGIISIAAGYYDHKLAVDDSGCGWAWGSGDGSSYGQLGVGDTDPHPEPTMMLCPEVSPSIYLTKTCDINEANCVLPDDYIIYTITYDSNGHEDSNVVVVDYLPVEVDYEEIVDANYDSDKHTYTWVIGDLAADDSNSVTLTVKVNECAAPNETITNYCEIEGDNYYTTATADTNIGPWEPNSDIVYVDCNSPSSPGNRNVLAKRLR